MSIEVLILGFFGGGVFGGGSADFIFMGARIFQSYSVTTCACGLPHHLKLWSCSSLYAKQPRGASSFRSNSSRGKVLRDTHDAL